MDPLPIIAIDTSQKKNAEGNDKNNILITVNILNGIIYNNNKELVKPVYLISSIYLITVNYLPIFYYLLNLCLCKIKLNVFTMY